MERLGDELLARPALAAHQHNRIVLVIFSIMRPELAMLACRPDQPPASVAVADPCPLAAFEIARRLASQAAPAPRAEAGWRVLTRPAIDSHLLDERAPLFPRRSRQSQPRTRNTNNRPRTQATPPRRPPPALARGGRVARHRCARARSPTRNRSRDSRSPAARAPIAAAPSTARRKPVAAARRSDRETKARDRSRSPQAPRRRTARPARHRPAPLVEIDVDRRQVERRHRRARVLPPPS